MQQLEQLLKQKDVNLSALNNTINAVLLENKTPMNELLTTFIGDQAAQKQLVRQIYNLFDIYQYLDLPQVSKIVF